jgi:aromatic-L-amino-acid decarboxylase
MTPDEFRVAGHELIEWIAGYLEGVEQYPVLAPAAPGSVRAGLPATAPCAPEPWADVLGDLDSVILPGITHWQHPKFFAYFPSNNSYSSVLGELASAGLAVNTMLWATSPAGTELETLMLDWMVDLLDLPRAFRSDDPAGTGGGVIQGTASEGVLCALLAAREQATGGASNLTGNPPGLVAYCTAQSHSSVEKAAGIAGIGREMLRKIPTDATFSMDADALAAAITADRAAGLTPFFVCATVGSTSSMAIDPVTAIGAICQREGLWLHVDAAMAGVAALVPEFRFVNAGLDFADSYCTNPHKWMGVQFDCDLFWVRDRQLLINALSILPEYLKTAAGQAGTVIDYRDWGVPLGRRFRALKLWFTLRLDGVEAIQEMMRRHVALAAEVEHWVNNDPRFVLAAPVRLNLVCFRHVDGDAATDALITNANDTGEVLFTRTVLDGRSVLRFSIGTHTTQRHHVAEAWALLESLA